MFKNLFPSTPLVLITDLEAVAHNYRTLCSQLKKGIICAAVLKANAYGMGAKEISACLYKLGCRHFFVAHLFEAIELKGFIKKKCFIYVLNGIRKGEEEIYANNEIIPILGDHLQITAWNNYCKKKQQCLKAALHFDTGLTRTGLLQNSSHELESSQLSNMEIVCVMSHLACAYQSNHPMNEVQRLSFDILRKKFPLALGSLSSSGGIFLGSQYHYDMVRIGLAFTGCRTSIPQGDYILRPALSAYAQILQINEITPGHSIGDDAMFITSRPSRIATLGVGYADGYLRSLSSRGEVYFEGKILPVVGRVSVNFTAIDVTDIPDNKIHVGDWVELFGENLLIDDLARKAGTVSWELFTGFGSRFERFTLRKGIKNLRKKSRIQD